MLTVVIDESGDVGLNNVLADPSVGPTQYFTMCATFFRDEHRGIIENKLEELPQRKGIFHANKLSHFDKVFCCRTVAALPIGMVGVISNKLSLLEYLPEAKKTHTHYYNKVAQYLFERVGATVAAMKVSKHDLRIVVEAREQQYSSLLSFIDKIQRNPIDHRAAVIRHIDRFSIVAVKKKDDPCMALSDLGAHALFCAVRRDARAHGLSETRYLRELAPVFFSDRSGRIVPTGIKPIQKLPDLELPLDTLDFFRNVKNGNQNYQKLHSH